VPVPSVPNAQSTVGPVLYQVWVNEMPYSNTPRILDAELDMCFGEHDLFYLRIELPRGVPVSQISIWPADTPIRVQWGRTPDLNMWYGYVNHYEISSLADSGTKAQQIEYVCIGTSSVLNPDSSRLWTNVSPTYIAKQIATENKFRAVVSPISWNVTAETQTNSNFDFLNYIANKYGLRFWCSNGSLYMVQPNIQLTDNITTSPPVYYANKLYGQQDTVRDFKTLTGNNIPGSVVANRALFGIDLVTGQPFSAVATPGAGSTSRVIIKQDTSVTSYYDAQQRINASAALSQFSTQAIAQVFGSTSLYPGKILTLAGSALPGTMAGNWLITCTKHKLLTSYSTNAAKDIFVTDVTLVRNTPTGVNLVNVQPIRPEFPACSLSKGQWSCFQPNVITETVT
jgi:phage protein D